MFSVAIVFVAAACGDDDEDNGNDDGGATAGATSTADNGVTPEATVAPAPTVGITAVDQAIAGVAARNPDAIRPLLSPLSAACTTAPGLGGPPPCDSAPGSPPEGTTVEAFPYNTCEREWQFDLEVVTERILDNFGDLYAVVTVTLPDTGDPLTPTGATHAIVFTSRDPLLVDQTAHALVLRDDAIITTYTLCGGTPPDFLADRPPLFAPQVILEGPAFN